MGKHFENLKLFIKRNNSKTEHKLAKILKEDNLIVSTAESCTGGLIASRLTDVSGSSEYFNEGYITYANDAKHKILGVNLETLQKFGAVSQECAFEMAQGLMLRTGCDVAICTTGIAGPLGGDEKKPVGLIYVSIKYHDKIVIKEFRLNPEFSRKDMKFQFSELALKTAIEAIEN